MGPLELSVYYVQGGYTYIYIYIERERVYLYDGERVVMHLWRHR